MEETDRITIDKNNKRTGYVKERYQICTVIREACLFYPALQ